MDKQFYIAIPCWVLTSKLTMSEKLVLGAIHSLSADTGYCYASNDYLAKCLGVEKGTVANCLCILSATGWVERGEDEKGGRTLTAIKQSLVSETPSRVSETPSRVSDSESRTSDNSENRLLIGKQSKTIRKQEGPPPTPPTNDKIKITEYVFLTEEYQKRLLGTMGPEGYKRCVKKLHNWVAAKAPAPGERESKDFKDAKRKAFNGGNTISNWVRSEVLTEMAREGIPLPTPKQAPPKPYTNGALNGAIDRLEALGVPVTRIGGGGQ